MLFVVCVASHTALLPVEQRFRTHMLPACGTVSSAVQGEASFLPGIPSGLHLHPTDTQSVPDISPSPPVASSRLPMPCIKLYQSQEFKLSVRITWFPG